MKRYALLIGYSASNSSSEATINTERDLENYKSYLMQLRGGAWQENEIKILSAPSKTILKLEIISLKTKGVDLVFIVFSGHGGYNPKEECRELLLNKNETILARDLLGIAKRQILICDSCSDILSESSESIEKKIQASHKITSNEIKRYREEYDKLCLNCEPQTLCLYAAKVGTSAEDLEGGIYTKALLETLQQSNQTISIVKAHDDAIPKVKRRTLKGDGSYQIPERQVTRARSFLPGAIVI